MDPCYQALQDKLKAEKDKRKKDKKQKKQMAPLAETVGEACASQSSQSETPS